MVKKILKVLLYALPYLFVFVYSFSFSKDPDLGWHLRYGEYFINHHQVLKDNLFSSQMVDFHWVNGGWLGDVFIFLVFENFGFLGLSFAGALVAVFTFYFFGNSVFLSDSLKCFLYPTIAFCVVNINNSSLRGQQISLLLIGVLIYILFKITNDFKKKQQISYKLYLLPFLFLFWANLHQQSTMGIGILFLWTVASFFTNKREFKLLLLFSAISFVVSLLNPFGFGIYKDSLDHLNDPLLKTVSEYQPFVSSSINWWKLFIFNIAALSLFTYAFYKKKVLKVSRIFIIMSFFLFAAFLNRRFAWPGYYLFIPFLASYLLIFPIKKEYYLKYISLIFITVLFAFVLVSKINMLKVPESWGSYCSNLRTPCSPKASNFLENKFQGKKIYTYYNWGGYLIWNNPKIKPSTDGRMHLWRDKNGFDAYEYDYLLELGYKSLDKSGYDAVFIPQYRTALYRELARLVAQKKWRLVYQDKTSLIALRQE